MLLIVSFISISFLIKSANRKRFNHKNLFSEKQIQQTFNKETITYLSAKEGTFDKNYFINEETNKFKFPNYNTDNKSYLVKIKDISNYKGLYFLGLNKEEKERFSFDDFEKIFLYPELEIECFEDFLERLGVKYFNSVIGKENSLYLFSIFDEFLEGTETDNYRITFDKTLAKKISEQGYIKILNELITKEYYLQTLSMKELSVIAEKNNLQPFKTKKALFNQVLKIDFLVPIIEVFPTIKLKEYFLSFITMYIYEIKRNADRFHPLYIERILEEASLSNDNPLISTIVDKEIESYYWKERLTDKIF